MDHHPAPDLPFEPTDTLPLEATSVSIRAVGLLPANNMAEVLATDGDGRWFRFYLKRTARVIRLFYRACGVSKGPGWLDGVVEHKTGVGNYNMEGTHIGNDASADGEEGEQTLVLSEVTLREAAR